MTTSRTGTTRWLHNAAAAKRSARAAGLEHCPLCHVRLTWDASLLPSSPEADHIVPHSRGAKETAESRGHRNANVTQWPEFNRQPTTKHGRVAAQTPGQGGYAPRPAVLAPPWV